MISTELLLMIWQMRFQTQDYYNNNLIQTKRYTFKESYPGSTLIVPEHIKRSKGANALYNVSTVHTYESNTSNPLEISKKGGAKTVFIWGYNKVKLIAKIENLSSNNLDSSTIANLQAVSNSDNDNCRTAGCKEQLLRDALNSLRTTLRTTYPEAFVTSFTYDPLVGITSATDSKGDVQYYNYDALQRLIKIVDKDNKIVSENEYHFKPQNP